MSNFSFSSFEVSRFLDLIDLFEMLQFVGIHCVNGFVWLQVVRRAIQGANCFKFGCIKSGSPTWFGLLALHRVKVLCNLWGKLIDVGFRLFVALESFVSWFTFKTTRALMVFVTVRALCLLVGVAIVCIGRVGLAFRTT